MSARILDVTIDEYHADAASPVPTLSSSIAHTLLTRSPLHAWTEHPRFGNVRPPPTEEVDDGQIIHGMLLGKGPQLEVIKADNYRTKAAQEIRDAARAAGRIPIIERKFAEVVSAAGKIKDNMAAAGVVLDGESEVAIEWTEENGVLCRCRLDHYKDGTIYDVKKIVSADAETCKRSANTYGYDIQRAAYVSAVEHLTPEREGRVPFLFVFVEMEPPYCVVVRPPSSALCALGESKWRRARSLWKRCMDDCHWPSYAPGELEALEWAMLREEAIIGDVIG